MTDVELIKKARNGDNNAKDELLNRYYSVIERFAKNSYKTLNDNFRMQFEIDNIFLQINKNILDETDVIDEFLLQAFEILNSFLPYVHENRFDIFLSEQLEKYSKKFVAEKLKEVISIMKTDHIGWKKFQSLPKKDNSFDIFNFPYYHEKFNLTIDEIFNFLSKYYLVSREEILNEISYRIVYVVNSLRLDDTEFNQKFLLGLKNAKIDYVKSLLQINIDKVTSLDALWLKKIEIGPISEIPYYRNLILEIAKETYEELIQYMNIDFEVICAEFFEYFNHKVREYFQTEKKIKLSDFNNYLAQWLLDKKVSFTYGIMLKTDLNNNLDKPFHN